MADMGRLNIEYLVESTGIICSFTTYLAANAIRLGNRCSLGFYLQEEMEQAAAEYLDAYSAKREEVDQLYDWIRTLPWPTTGYLVFAYNW